MAALREKASQADRDLNMALMAAHFGEHFDEQTPTSLIATAAARFFLRPGTRP